MSEEIVIIEKEFEGQICAHNWRYKDEGSGKYFLYCGLAKIDYSPCNPSLCPLYQIWKLLEKRI